MIALEMYTRWPIILSVSYDNVSNPPSGICSNQIHRYVTVMALESTPIPNVFPLHQIHPLKNEVHWYIVTNATYAYMS